MKKIFLFAAIVLVSLATVSQNKAINIVRLTKDPLDQAAKTHPKTDVNGDLYALIKVRPACDHLKFSFGYMKCLTDNTPHENETWLYVQKNARRISISGDGYDPVMNADLGQTLDDGTTYVLELKFGKEPKEDESEAFAYQYVVFRVPVANAIIRVNGKSLTTKDGAVSTKLPFGKHEYEIIAPMYETTVGLLTVDDTRSKQEVDVNMVPLFRDVTLKVTDGAEIWVDGERKGTGVWSGGLEFSSYSIECRKAGCRPSQQTLVIGREGPSDYTLTPPTPLYGSIEVEVEPVDAEVWLDGKLVGATPMLLTKVLAVEHEIKVRKSGYEELTGSVVVKESEKSSLTGTLKESAIAQASGQSAGKPSGNLAGTSGNHEWVDMGLSVKWATCNIGANAPEDYGDYFAWGETSPKNSYSWSNLKYCLDSNGNKFSKYVASSSYGTVDNKTVLEPEDDAAQVNWGGGWRMPTKAEFQELIDKCTWTWTTMNGKNGYKVVSKVNGSSVFFPAAGYRSETSLNYAGSDGSYWSSSLSESSSCSAWELYFYSGNHAVGSYDRYYGQSVRPVCH